MAKKFYQNVYKQNVSIFTGLVGAARYLPIAQGQIVELDESIGCLYLDYLKEVENPIKAKIDRQKAIQALEREKERIIAERETETWPADYTLKESDHKEEVPSDRKKRGRPKKS